MTMKLSRAAARTPLAPASLRQARRGLLGTLAVAAAALLAPLGAQAQAFPDKPLRLVVPFAAGGAADVVGRAIADQLQVELGKPVVVVNRDGAGTIVGVNYAAKAAPDGYTLLLSGDAATINTASGRNLPYDFLKELTPISTLFAAPQFLVVRKDSPFQSLGELVSYAQQNPGKLKFGSSGIGTSIHLSEETFNAAAGIEALHVPYRGVAPAVNDLIGGQIDYVIAGSSTAVPAVQSGQLRALAINSKQRSTQLPDVPTAIEQGVNVETMGWYGLFVTAGTPPEAVERLHAATQDALRSPEITKRFTSVGGEARPASLAETRKFVEDEIAKFSALIKRLGIKLD